LARSERIALRKMARQNKRTWFKTRRIAWKGKRSHSRLSKNLI